MREVVYTMIVGNPNIPKQDKPVRSSQVYRVTDDKKAEEQVNNSASPTDEEIQIIKNLWVS
jgi:hypothetical protein